MKKIITLLCAVLLVASLYATSFSMEKQSSWQAAYAGQIMAAVRQYNASESEEKCGMFISLLDLDVDGTPELYIGFIEMGQIDHIAEEFLYRYEDGMATQITIDAQPAGLRRYLLASITMPEKNAVYLLESEAFGKAVVYKATSNEGTYDYFMTFERAILDGDRLRLDTLASFDLPADLEAGMVYDEEASAYFAEKAFAFLSDYSVLDEDCQTAYKIDAFGGVDVSLTDAEALVMMHGYAVPSPS